MILRPWLGQNKPPLGVHPIPGHALMPKASWLLNEGSGDRANDVVGTRAGSITGAVWNPSGLYFDGTNDVVVIPDAPLLRTSGPLSVSILAKTDTVSGNAELFSKNIGVASDWLILRVTTGWRFYVGGLDSVNAAIANLSAVANEWVHIVGVSEPGPATHIYLNGILKTSATTPLAAGGTMTGDIRIGLRYDGTNDFLGEVAHASWYDRALSGGEVAALAAQQFSWLGVPDLAAMWAAGQAGGEMLFDDWGMEGGANMPQLAGGLNG